jgi:phospholipid transport system substrate-binding protein
MIPRPLLLLASLVLAHGAGAASTAEAEAQLHAAVNGTMAIAERATTTRGLAEKVRPVLMKHIAFEAMTRRAIGPGWRQFSPDQRKEATSLFATLIIRKYAGKYTPGARAEVTYKAAVTPAPGRVEIPTTLLYQGSRYAVLYRLEQAEGWRITDIVAEGVSLVANYRTQFASEFQKGGPSGVLGALQRSVAAP